MNIKQFEEFIDSVFQSEGIDANDLPLNIPELARKLWDVTLCERNGLNEVCSSYIAFKGGNCFMAYNAEESQEKINLLCAHELVHYFLQDKTESHKGYRKKTRHNANSIEMRADRYARIIVMPRYLVKQLKNIGFSHEQIIKKCGFEKNKKAGRERLEELNMSPKTDIAEQKSFLEKTFKKDSNDIDVPFYPKNKIEDLILNRKSTTVLRVNKFFAKNADFVVNLSGIEIDGEKKPENYFGFINAKSTNVEEDLLMLSKDFHACTSRKPKEGYKILGKITIHCKIPKPVIISVPVKEQQISLFNQ